MVTDPGDPWRGPVRALLLLRWLEGGLLTAVPFGLAVAAAARLAGVVQAGAVAGLGVVSVGLVLAVLHRRWSAWGFRESAHELTVRRGVLVRTTTVVPYGRLQFVDVMAGPLERRMGLARIAVHTAAAHSTAVIPGLTAPEAVRLRDRLAALAADHPADL